MLNVASNTLPFVSSENTALCLNTYILVSSETNNIATFTVEEEAVGGAAIPLKTEPEFWDNIPKFDAVQELLHKKLSVSRLKAAQ